ncbi:uncharacterized protein [Physcomitrium patens]|uniref:Transmembrane protein n=1 Tax=Physcomitrium patens TaxID=3218 RepID=A0A2K1KLS0_PHYPA|nr:uncharacterized protein LOC112281148 [Physcomitrium patens]XP_024373127.1 uncharacterized protein LOC112281148 [Physcomitrium patens]XP_024373130.1 uncharacterized protein LOC112281148 [Physcomitrium patens]XP_024373131.1 uncharacterized protein LOC112281148 [Physcomitrium patens]PNR54723.1 hypothetical protein PHYPA_005616 [Physcomitrium patens]|eukprot:XP_024373126.1 uncharacterized protein LOC112281148 [Physcomitrella patens]
MDPAQTSNQGRIGLEGRGGTKVPGNMLSRHTFRYVFVGGMFAAGIAWYASSHGMLGSAGEKMIAASRGGSKPPTVPGKEQVDEAPSASRATTPSGQAHTGTAQGHAEGLKPK